MELVESQSAAISKEIGSLLPRLLDGGVVPRRYVQASNARYVASVTVDDNGSPIVKFEREKGTVTPTEASCLHGSIASVATISEFKGGAAYSYMHFRLAHKVVND